MGIIGRFHRLLTASVVAASASLGQQPAYAQDEYRTVAGVADKFQGISPPSGPSGERGVQAFSMRQATELPASRRLGIATERVSFGVREFPVRRREVLGIDLSDASRKIVEGLGLEVLRSYPLRTLGVQVDVLRVPRGQTVMRALSRLRAADPNGAYEANSIFESSADEIGVSPKSGLTTPATKHGILTGELTRRMGVIDTGVDATLGAFAGAVLAQKNFGRGRGVTPRTHGTAVAAIARASGAEQLLIADVFSGEPSFADVEGLVRALDWMAGEEIGVINMSLAGPQNALLELAVARIVRRGHIIVAAVGNDGPDMPPQFPAAYPAVIGVTAVDLKNRIYVRANRGEGVDVAALGVGVKAVRGKALSGTSYAAPVVSAYLVSRMPPHAPTRAEEAMALIDAVATDLGEPGFDFTYGAGVLNLRAYAPAVRAESE